MKKRDTVEIISVILAIIFCFVGFIFLEKIFSKDIGEFSKAIFSAVIGSIFTVAAMTVVIKLQTRQDREKEYLTKLFEKKLDIYKGFLELMFEADDDNVLEKEEIQNLENKVGEISLVAGAGLVSCLVQFMLQLKIYGCIYPRSMSLEQRKHFINYFSKNELLSINKQRIPVTMENFEKLFVKIDEVIQAIRFDLNVVEGDIKEGVSKFISIRIDPEKMTRNPNIID